MLKKAISLFLAAGLALVGIPLGAAQGLPSSISGKPPAGEKDVASAVLQDGSGKNLSMVPVTDGKFLFHNLTPGEYYVALFSASGQRIALSCPVNVVAGAQKDVSFDCPAPPVVPPTSTTAAPVASTSGGLSTTGWILIGAAAAGITTAVVIATNKDEGPASPIR